MREEAIQIGVVYRTDIAPRITRRVTEFESKPNGKKFVVFESFIDGSKSGGWKETIKDFAKWAVEEVK